MKTSILIAVFGLSLTFGFSQTPTTATNFSGYDCAGKYHDFFNEMNSGTVIVMSWVMPCGACASPSMTAYSAAQSFATSHPGRVVMYVSDDYADTPCSSISSWVNSNSMPNAIKFVDAKIKMSNYGTAGMPKIVVMGGPDHKVLYNSNNSANLASIKSAINTGLSATTVIKDQVQEISDTYLFMDPSNNLATISYSQSKTVFVKVDVLNSLGQIVTNVHSGTLPQGENKIELSTAKLNQGIYFVKITNNERIQTLKFIVSQ